MSEPLAVCRLPPGSRVPSWALELHHAFLALVRTEDELLVVCPEAAVPPDVDAEAGWRLAPDGAGELVFGAHALVRTAAPPSPRPAAARADRRRVSSGSPFEPRIGFSRALRAGRRVLVSGTGPVLPGGDCPEGTLAQARRCWEIVLHALAEAGASVDDVVRTRTLLTPAADADAAMAAHGEVFADVRPASTMLVVHALLDDRWTVEVEAEAELSVRDMPS
jgi:enamine deaminase RidA (YjgF/YER057c/UK114 family)